MEDSRQEHDDGDAAAAPSSNLHPRSSAPPPPPPTDCNWRLGTIGFSYADWAGPFYPRGMKPGEYLPYYARFFDAVELHTTFHAIPPPSRIRRWADATPEHFRFTVKSPRAVTHEPLAG